MPDFTRNLNYQSPLVRGPDVLAAQRALRSLGAGNLEADGLFGAQTASAVSDFQRATGLPANGAVDASTWSALFRAPAAPPDRRDIAALAARLAQPQRFRDSVTWRLGPHGIEVGGQPAAGTPGQPITVMRIIDQFGSDIDTACTQRQIPVELVIATIAVESSADPRARRQEPGWTSDDATPARVSIGLMQTLISTARTALNDSAITGAWLESPENSIAAGTAYMDSQFALTGFDPPKVGCAYNAGGLYYEPSATNRWKMRQYPIGTGTYADRLVMFFNDCFSLLQQDSNRAGAGPSLAAEFREADLGAQSLRSMPLQSPSNASI